MLHAMYVYKPKIQNLILKCMRKFFSVCWPWLCKSSMYPNVNFYGKWLYLSVQYVSCWYKFPYKTFICKDFSYLSLVQAPEQLLWIGMLEIKKYGKVSVQSFFEMDAKADANANPFTPFFKSRKDKVSSTSETAILSYQPNSIWSEGALLQTFHF